MASSKVVKTPIGKLMFPSLFRPAVQQQGDPRYQAVLVFDTKAQQTPAFAELKAAVEAEARRFFNGSVPRGARNPLIKVDDTDYPEKYQGFEKGDVMIRPWSKFQPGLVDRFGEDILIESDVWAGQLWRCEVEPVGYENSGNKGVALMLGNMQQAKPDMPRLDGRKSAKQSFADDELPDEFMQGGASSSNGGDAGDGFFN